MKTTKKLLAIFLTVILLFTSIPVGLVANAARSSYIQGISFSATPDKSKYSWGDDIYFDVYVTNNSNETLKNLKVYAEPKKATLFNSIEGSGSAIIPSLAPGETKSVELMYNAEKISLFAQFFLIPFQAFWEFFFNLTGYAETLKVKVGTFKFKFGFDVKYVEENEEPEEPDEVLIMDFSANKLDIAVSTTETVTFKATVDNDVLVDSIVVIDENNKKIGDLYDNGLDYDDIANDNVWSGGMELYSSEGKNIKYFPQLTYNNTSITDDTYVEICYYTDLTDEDFNNVDTLVDELSELEADMTKKGKNKSDILNAAYNYIISQDYVSDAKKTNDSVVFITDARIHMVFSLGDKDTKSASTNVLKSNVSDYNISKSTNNYNEYTVPNKKSILVIRPYYGIDANFGTKYLTVANSIANKLGYSVTNITGTNVTLDVMKNFDDYGIILVDSHGYLNQFESPNTSNICLTQTYSSDIHSADYQSGRILVTQSGSIWVAPSFFDAYYTTDKMQNSLVYLGICHGLETTSLSSSLIKAGAKSVIGYDDSVSFVRDENMLTSIFNEMIKDDKNDSNITITVSDACETARKNNPGTPNLLLRGSYGFDKLVLRCLGDLNLGFENQKTYWDGSGDFRIISQCGSLYPTEGDYMAIIGTGLGAVSDSTSILTRTFKVTDKLSSLSFDYDVVSEEPSEYVGSIYNDTFVVNVTFVSNSGSQTSTILKETVNSSSWEYLGENYFNGGDNTTYHTGWKTHNINIPEGTTEIMIEMKIWDLGDSIYDTATLIDNFVLNK